MHRIVADGDADEKTARARIHEIGIYREILGNNL